MRILRGILKDVSYVVFLCFIMLTVGGIAFGVEKKEEVLPAKNLIDIECKQEEGSVQVKVVADGSIAKYHAFELREPNRLVVDIFGVGSLYSGQNVSIGHPLLEGIRIGVSAEKVRLVLDLPGKGVSPYEINKEGNGLAILLKEPSKKEVRHEPALVAKPIPVPLEKEAAKSHEENAAPADTWSSRVLKSLDFSGELTSKVATDLNKDNDVEDLFDFRNHLLLKLQCKLNDQVKLFVSEQIKYIHTNTDDNFESNFWEGYINFSSQNCDFRIGKQIVRWGKTDELSPLDIINPQEYEEFVLSKLNDRKIPIFLAKINYYLGGYNLEGVFIPFFKESHIPSFNSDWAAFDHLKEAVAKSTAPSLMKGLINSTDVRIDKPARTFDNCSFGLRVLRTLGRFDLGVSYLYTRNTLPTVDSVLFKGEGNRSIGSMEQLLGFFQGIDPASLSDVDITYQYKRMNVFGGEMETTWGNVGIRAELAYFHKISFANRERSKVDKDFVHYVIGADYTWGENLYTNLQFSQQIVPNYEELLWQKKITSAFNGTIRKEFMQGFLIPELYFYWNTTDGDYYLNPFVTYKYSDNISLIGGVYFLGGERDTLFGSFKDNNEIYFSLKFTF